MAVKPVLKKYLTVTLMFIISAVLYGCEKRADLKKIFDDINLGIKSIEAYSIISDSDIKDDTNNIRVIRAVSGDDIMRIQLIKNISKKKAMNYIDNQRYLIGNLYGKQKVPYPGPLTKIMGSPEELRPVVKEKKDPALYRIVFNMYANDRLVYGGFDEGSLEYAMLLVFIHNNEKKQLIRMEFFTPKDKQSSNYNELLSLFNM